MHFRPYLLTLFTFSLFLFSLVVLPISLLGLIPIFFGQEPAIGLSPIERNLVLLNQAGSAQIIVGGDSRAKVQVNPAILTQETQLKCINVAELLNLGGDIPTLVKVLKKNPQALANRPLILLSVNVESFNDLGYTGTPLASLLSWTPWDHAQVAFRNPKSYPRFFVQEYLPGIRSLVIKKWKGERLPSADSLFHPPGLLASRGYEPFRGRQADEDLYLWPKEWDRYLLKGARWRDFQSALEWLAKSPAQRIILYSAPLDTSRVLKLAGGEPLKIPALLSRLLQSEIAKYPKIAFWDFYPSGVPGLVPELDFYDYAHLNSRGAEIFSHYLGKRIAGATLP